MSEELLQQATRKLQQYWGYESFRPGQDEVIQSIFAGNDTLVLFPTGGGKSLCYQLPALMMDGLTVVISPLVALMQDQVYQLKERNIPATFINSTLSSWEIEQRLVNARNGMYKLLYCAPERLKTTLWEAELPNLDIDLVAIDEAHCISEWGHDFRPSYREISPALEPIADSVKWIALTATATPEVRDDIINNLQFDDPTVVSKGFQRPNLKWWVAAGPKKDRNLIRSVKQAAPKGSGIIYGGTRKNCERLAEKIEQQLGVKAEAYHAGIDGAERQQIQDQWIGGEVPIVVATTAFGMGIDKADCRYVIHYQIPYSLEAYYQQAGRAGRDGEESFPLLLFKQSDVHRARKRIEDSYPEKEQLQKVYDALCDMLSLAISSEEEQMREVSIPALKQRAQLPASLVRAALRVLSNLGIIEMTEHVLPQIGIQFIVNPDYLRNQIKSEKNKRKATFLDVLFRQFGGEAFGEMKYLNLDYLERKLDIGKNGLIKGLQVLQNHDQILKFESLGALPLVRPVEARMKKLPLTKTELEQHRDNLLDKLDYMVGYIETDGCREVYIRTYFGEENATPCGHCDNCLNSQKSSHINIRQADVEALRKVLENENKLELGGIKRELQWTSTKVKQMISYLVRENKIAVSDEKYYWCG